MPAAAWCPSISASTVAGATAGQLALGQLVPGAGRARRLSQRHQAAGDRERTSSRAIRTARSPLDPVEASALVYLVAFDLARLDLGFALGTDHPGSAGRRARPKRSRNDALPGPDGIGTHGAAGHHRHGQPDRWSSRTVATFTGGFKREHGAFRYGDLASRNHGSHYGFIEDGVVFSKLQPGLATLFVIDDGTVDMKTWAADDDRLLAADPLRAPERRRRSSSPTRRPASPCPARSVRAGAPATGPAPPTASCARCAPALCLQETRRGTLPHLRLLLERDALGDGARVPGLRLPLRDAARHERARAHLPGRLSRARAASSSSQHLIHGMGEVDKVAGRRAGAAVHRLPRQPRLLLPGAARGPPMRRCRTAGRAASLLPAARRGPPARGGARTSGTRPCSGSCRQVHGLTRAADGERARDLRRLRRDRPGQSGDHRASGDARAVPGASSSERGGRATSNPSSTAICGAPYMAPLYDPAREQPEDAKACIDQFEFPDIPCAYPVVWVRAREAARAVRGGGQAPVRRARVGGRLRRDASSRPTTASTSPRARAPNAAVERMRAAHNQRACGEQDLELRPGLSRGRLRRGEPEERRAATAAAGRSAARTPIPTGSFPECQSPLGVYDLNGNAAEHMNLPLDEEQMASRGSTDARRTPR